MNRLNRLTIYILALGVFVTATAELVVSGILPVIAEDLSVTVALAGQLITAYSLAFAIGTPILTALTSRIGRKKVLVGALSVFLFGCLVGIVSTDIVMLMISRVILGASSGVYLVVAFSAAAKIVPADKVGGAIGTIVLGFSSAIILGVPIGIAVTSWIGWHAIFVMLGLLSLLITAIIARLLPDISGDEPVPFRRQLNVLGSLTIVSGLFLTLFRESGNSVLFTYLTPFMTDILHMNISGVSSAMLIFGIFGAVGSRAGGYAVDRWGAARVVTFSLIVQLAALVLLPSFAASLYAGLGLIAVILTSMFAGGPAIQTYFIQQAPQSSSLVLSLNTSVIHLGLAAGAGIGGVTIHAASTSLYNPWVACFVVALGLTAAAVSFTARKKRSLIMDGRS